MKRLTSFFRRKILRIPADRWDYQYAHGEWENLATEAARFQAVIKLITDNYPSPSILEIGCGKALMLQHMKATDYSNFVGVDLSEVAIAYASKYNTERVQFVSADMQSFQPVGTYDVVTFNESLYYAKDPAEVFARYIPYLNRGGSIIVTAFDNKYTAHLWPALKDRWTPAIVQKVTVGDLNWNINLYRL
jgi:2-polyprenyl-3-methyl-5-hydroxy-6-metoxy-1,4-benzoquinol methylase